MDKDSLLLTAVTSLKLWAVIYGLMLVLWDTVFFSYVPILLLGSLGLFGILFKFRVPSAQPNDVNHFFGPYLRPSINDSLNSGSAPIEDQQGLLTVKSRLLLMKSPQMTSTPTSDSANGSGRNKGRDQSLIIIGHRAAGLDAPENSISAIRQCKMRGCEVVEFDVSLTKDLIPVLFHDDNLLRIAGIDREIRDMTWEELKRVDISILHPLGEKFRKERVPKLDETIDLCMSIGMKFIIDLKDDNEHVVNAIVEAFQRRRESMYSMAVVSSFYVKVIHEIRRRDPRIIGCMAWRPGYYRYTAWSSNWEQLEPRHRTFYQDAGAIVLDALNEWGIKNIYWWFVGLSAILFHKDAITKEESYRWTKKGIRTYLWTVNAPLEKLHIVQNVQLGFLTDTLFPLTLDGGEVNTVNGLNSPSIQAPSPIRS